MLVRYQAVMAFDPASLPRDPDWLIAIIMDLQARNEKRHQHGVLPGHAGSSIEGVPSPTGSDPLLAASARWFCASAGMRTID
jgi:hypothetical protein